MRIEFNSTIQKEQHMNWESIGAIGETLGALAVLITLIYLSLQVRKTNEMSKFDTSREVMASFDNLNKMVVTDASLRKVLHKMEELNLDEQEQLYNFVNMYCNTWVVIQTAHDNNLIDQAFYESGMKDVEFELERWPRFREYARLWLDRYPGFKNYGLFAPLTEND
jgi:hypothetical protein